MFSYLKLHNIQNMCTKRTIWFVFFVISKKTIIFASLTTNDANIIMDILDISNIMVRVLTKKREGTKPLSILFC